MRKPSGLLFTALCCFSALSIANLSGCKDNKSEAARTEQVWDGSPLSSTEPQQDEAALTAPKAKEKAITLTTPDWNSLTWPLEIRTYYLETNAAAGISDFSIEMDLYSKGVQPKRFPRTIGNGKTHSESPLRLNLALYIQDAPDDTAKLKLTRVLAWGGKQGSDERHTYTSRSHSFLSKQVLDFGTSSSHGTFPNLIPASGRTPLFYIITIGRDPAESVTIASGATPEELVAKNPDATILIFYIKTENRTQDRASTQD